MAGGGPWHEHPALAAPLPPRECGCQHRAAAAAEGARLVPRTGAAPWEHLPDPSSPPKRALLPWAPAAGRVPVPPSPGAVLPGSGAW